MESKALRRVRRKLTVEILWLYVAKALLGSKPVKAYDIVKILKSEMGLKVSTITIYSVVYRMAGEGLLETVKVGGETLYKLSERGRMEFEKAVKFIESVIQVLKS
jgi:DNA-binding PadR family transcriptional regulator|uniref:PadR family transcriptional regulator n=1 Tax=Ignisphaera aggregans TaxID=334771 RepID=A0A7J2U021_9CREN